MNFNKHFFCQRPTLFFALGFLSLITIFNTLSAHAISHINGVDLREEQGNLNLYVHTDSPLRHEAKIQGKALVLDLYETALTSNAFAIQYEKAPSIQGVSVKHLDNGHLQLIIEGKGLKLPIVGFRELNGSRSTRPFKQATLLKRPANITPSVNQASKPPKASAGDVFLAIESSEAQKIPTQIESLTPTTPSKKQKPPTATDDLSIELNPNVSPSPNPNVNPRVSPLLESDPSIANMPIAIESDALEDGNLEEDDSPESTGIRQTTQTLLVLLAQWAKAHANLLLGFLLMSSIGLFFLNKFKKHVSSVDQRLDSEKRFILEEHSKSFTSTPFEASTPSYATSYTTPRFTTQEKPAYQHTMQRVREKMKHTGFSASPETAPQQDAFTEDGVNLRVKEAIARKQAQRYGKIAQVPVPPIAKNAITPVESPTGNAFLHAMAQHMDTDGKENIAKALQQSKPQY
jgi:hypothetical protein